MNIFKRKNPLPGSIEIAQLCEASYYAVRMATEEDFLRRASNNEYQAPDYSLIL